MKYHENREITNENQKQHVHKHNPMKHMWMMVLCCGLPLLLLLAVPFLGVFGLRSKLTILSVIPFLCPIMMLFMIPMMMKSSKDGKSCCDENKKEATLPEKNLD